MTYQSQSSILNRPDYIRLTVQTMKFPIVKPCPFVSLLGPNIRPSILFQITLACVSPLMYETQFYNNIAQLTILMFYIF